ncbi:hypothetical protein N9D75_01325 [Pseudomonadales bacterium]|nr:hypothetical protein [Pseudomonadales bacterium]
MEKISSSHVLIYAVRGTDQWWNYVGKNMGFDRSSVVSDIKGKGDFSVVNDFYKNYAYFSENDAQNSRLLTTGIVVDVVKRCRVLRSMEPRVARSMVMSMAEALDIVLEKVNPSVIVAFPIDRYVSDVLEHLAKSRGVPFYELAVSALPGMGMLMKKGTLITRNEEVCPTLIEQQVAGLTEPLFAPSYVEGVSNFSLSKWLRVFLYFRLRGWVFKLISMLFRDPLNLHYLDAQSFLPHKATLRDWKVLHLIDSDWRAKAEEFPIENRVFFGLTVFPEASIDYWIRNLDLIKYEEIILEAAKAFSEAGFLILIKDHPQQFGFRQKELIEKLLNIENAVLVPYAVSGNEVLMMCGTNFSSTGTLGLQAALLGKHSIVVMNYYAQHDSFVFFESKDEISSIPMALKNKKSSGDLKSRQHCIVERLLRGSFSCDFFSFVNFNPKKPGASVAELGRVLGEQIRHHQN